MSKAVWGAAEIAAGLAVEFVPGAGQVAGFLLLSKAALATSLLIGGASMEAGAIADALTQNRGMGVTTRQPAAYRQVIYGEQRVGGVIVYQSTTGSHLDQWNYVIVLAGHECDSILNLYLDGRQVHWEGSGPGWAAGPGGNYFGGNAGGGTFIGPGGQHYNFDTLVYCEARYGNQEAGDVIAGLTANDPNWAPTATGSPYLGGCTYVYLKIEYDAAMFPSMPEIKFTVRGKNDIYDPRDPAPPDVTVLQYPTVLLNGWGPNEQEGAYEEGEDQGYNWGLNDATTLSYTNANAACDGSLSTYAVCTEQHTHQYAGCIWSFANIGTPPGNLWLNVNSSVPAIDGALRSAGVWYTLDNGNSWTEIYNQSFRAQQWDSIELSPTQNCANVQVMAFLDSHDDMDQRVYDIQLATGPQTDSTQTGYTTNWALIVADMLTNSQFGLGDVGSVNTDQLIAAANVCDEQVDLANGNVEARYSCHWHFDCAVAPGDQLETVMPAAQGRLSRIGGEWFIWPAYWTGPSTSIDANSITGAIQWTPKRKARELWNRINGTYIAANYPYNVAGDLYDSNGWYDGTIQNNFPYAFQPTNYPQYACDQLHGYAQDIYLAQDQEIPRPYEITQNCVLSIAQAQRCAKIALLRNRQQGSGSLPMDLNTMQVQPVDVIEMDFPFMGWYSKQLEVIGTHLSADKNDDGVPVLRYNIQVQETDQSVYEWNPETDELTAYDVPSNPTAGVAYVIAPPTGLTLTSNANTAVINGGIVTPRILASWTAPTDARVTQVQIQYSISGANNWIDDGTVAVGTTSDYLSGLVTGQSYDVQIASITASGATSVWTQALNCTVVAPNSTTNSYTNNPQFDLTQPTATTIAMGNVAVSYSNTVNYAARTFAIATPTSATWYYVTIADPQQGGETGPTLAATCQTSTGLVGATGNVYIGAINALPTGNATQILAGGWPAPQTTQVGD